MLYKYTHVIYVHTCYISTHISYKYTYVLLGTHMIHKYTHVILCTQMLYKYTYVI